MSPTSSSLTTTGSYGLKKCCDPNGASVDIVFVHGLTGNRETTWTDKNTGLFWPADLLGEDIPRARVFSYGYDADIAHFWAQASQNRIRDHANTLLGRLGGMRERTETADRPLIFVVHSLGGLVIEDMLLSSRSSAEPHLARILECTRALAFLGTPHGGSDHAKLATAVSGLANILQKSSNTPLLGILKPDSEVLARIQQEFHMMLRARRDAGKPKIEIYCFYEELPVKGVGDIVPRHSAILSEYASVGIHANHMDMPKFSSAEDPGYQDVLAELWRWERDIRKAAETQSSSSSDAPLPPVVLDGGQSRTPPNSTRYLEWDPDARRQQDEVFDRQQRGPTVRNLIQGNQLSSGRDMNLSF